MKINSYDLPNSNPMFLDKISEKKVTSQDTFKPFPVSQEVPKIPEDFLKNLEDLKYTLSRSSLSVSSHKLSADRILKILSQPAKFNKVTREFFKKTQQETLKESNLTAAKLSPQNRRIAFLAQLIKGNLGDEKL